MPKVAFLSPGSANAGFYSEFAAFNVAIKALPWRNWEPELYVSMGPRAQCEPHNDSFERWRPHLQEVNFSYVSDAAWEREENWAQVGHTLLMAPRDADVLVTVDADTFPVAEFESVLDEVHASRSIAGVMAHFPPPLLRDADAWSELAAKFEITDLDISHDYSLLGLEIPQGPLYFNGGVVFFARPCFEQFVRPSLQIRSALVEISKDFEFYSAQIAMTLAISKLGIPCLPLPVRYNYPNDDIALRTQPGELENAIFFHYLRTHDFDRQEIFTCAKEYEKFLAKSLSNSNLAFQTQVKRILGSTYPFS